MQEYPVKAKLYEHQKQAVGFALERFGVQGGDATSPSGCALLMEM